MNEIANEVEINIVAHDRTAAAFAAAEARAKKFAATVSGTASKAGEQAGEELADGVDEGMKRSAKDAEKRGKEIREKLIKGFDGPKAGEQISGWFDGSFRKTSVGRSAASGRLIAAAVLAGLAALPAAAGTVGSATALAFGGGLAAIGIAAAAQSRRVRNEFTDLKYDVFEGLRTISGPLEQSLLKIPDVIRRTGRDLKPFLKDAFADMAPSVNRFVDAIGHGVASLGPKLVPLTDGFNAVLNAIADRAPEIFGDIGDGLETLGNLAVKHADDFAAFTEAVSSAFEGTASFLDKLADDWDEFTDFWGKVFGSGGPRQEDEMPWEYWSRMFSEGRELAGAAESAMKRVADTTREVGRAAYDAAAGVGNLRGEFEALTGGALQLDEAASKYQEAFDEATESIRKNGQTISIHTEKGRENRDALRDMAKAAQEHLSLMAEEGAGLGTIATKYQTYRSNLITAARAAGLTRKQARDLADAWLGVPRSVRTLVTARTAQAESAIERVRRLMNSVGSKTVYMTVQQVLRTVPGVSLRQLMQAHGGNIGGSGVARFQSGGNAGSAGSAMAVVGEQGPELVRLPVGSTVIPAGQSASMMSAGAARAASSISMAFRAPVRGGDGASADVAKSIKDLTKELREIVGLREGMSKFTEGVMGQGRAFIAYEAALDRAAASVKKNGRTLNIGREKGRENRTALMDLAQAAHEATFAMHNLGRPASAIVAKMKEQRAEFIKIARSMGLTTKEAKALADKWGLLPSTVKSVLAKEVKDKAYNKAAEKFNATLKTKASGGPAGGMTLVGESGPELVRLPFGSSVVPAGQTAGMMGGSGGVLHVTLQIGATQLGELVIDPLRKAVRTRGGNVQAVLGRA